MGAVNRARTVRGIAFGDVGPDIYEGVDGEEPTGSASMTAVVVMYVHSPTDVVERQVSRTNSISNGFNFLWIGGSGIWSWDVGDSGGNLIRAQPSGDADENPGLVVATLAFDGEARAQVNGVTATGAVNAGGYSEPSAARSLTFGAQDNSQNNPSNSIALLAFLIDQSNALSAAQLSTLEDEVRDHLRHGRDLATATYSVFSPDHGYDALDAGASWEDRVGAGTTLSRSGSPERANFRGAA